MSETTATPPAAAGGAATAPATTPAAAPATPGTPPAPEAPVERATLSIRSLLEAGAHFGHQTHRWNPQMRSYIFGARNGTHILDLDQTLPLFAEALEFLTEVTAQGGKVLFVGTKRQASPVIQSEARRAGQYYVNNRWLGGMLTNWKTVRKSIDRYKQVLEIQGDEEKRAALSKKEMARVNRLVEKYRKSLEGIVEMSKLPDAVFVIDVSKEEIAVSEARRLGIPIIAIVDSNCNPRGVDFVVPGNDDAIRAVDLYCKLVAQACIEGEQEHQNRILSEPAEAADEAPVAAGPSTGRRVVEIKQAPRRGRGQGSGRTHTSGGWAERDAAAAPASPAPASPAPASPAPASPAPASPAPASPAPASPAPAAAAEAAPEPSGEGEGSSS